MGFGDLKTPAGLKALNEYMASRSYLEGYTPSKADKVVFEALGGAPGADYVNALRWYNHILSYGGERNSFPGQEKAVTAYGSGGAAAPAAADDDDDDDDDVDLFGSDDEEEDAEAAKIREERLAAYAAKKSNKPALIAKSMITLDVKPWDDETDLKAMEDAVRGITMDGLVWGVSQFVPVGYGIKKLQITCVVEDAKVGTDDLEEQIIGFEDYVQSMDIVAFNKL